MKAASAIAWALLIFGFILFFMFTTVFAYRYRITVEVNYYYNYNNVQLALLTLLSSTHEKEQVAKLLAEHLTLNQPADMKAVLVDKLDKIVESKCYTLTASNLIVNGTNIDCTKKYAAKAKIVYPYNPNITGDVILVVG